MAMSIELRLRRLLGRAAATIDRSARFTGTARLFNPMRDAAAIRVGRCSIVAGELLVFAHGGRIEIGDWCFVGEGTRLWSAARISVGDRVLISHGVNIFDNDTHPYDPQARHAHFRAIYEVGHPTRIDLREAPVRIDDDAWIGTGAIVLKGVTIGRAAIVAAHSVVTRDVAPGVIVAGNPARVVRALDPDPALQNESAA